MNDGQVGLPTLRFGLVRAFLTRGARQALDLKRSIILTSHGGPYRPEALYKFLER